MYCLAPFFLFGPVIGPYLLLCLSEIIWLMLEDLSFIRHLLIVTGTIVFKSDNIPKTEDG